MSAIAGQAGGTVSEQPHGKPLIMQIGDQRHTFATEFTAGREGSLAIDDDFASSQHARFQTVRGLWYVEDLDSTNGTRLNGRRIFSAQLLKKRDKIEIGHTVMTVVSALAGYGTVKLQNFSPGANLLPPRTVAKAAARTPRPHPWALTERERTAIALVPDTAWEAAIDAKGEARERRADEVCPNERCGHRDCWTGEAHVTELTGLLRKGPGGDRLKAWPKAMRVFARRERPHPGAQLTLFEAADGSGRRLSSVKDRG